MHRVTLDITYANAGAQRRPYGPHVHDATIEVTLPDDPTTVGAVYYLDREYVETVIRALVVNYCPGTGDRHDGSMDDYYSPHLVTLERTTFEPRRRAVWHVVVETPFTD